MPILKQFLYAAVALSCLSVPAAAQTKPLSCVAEHETIVYLRQAHMGFPTVWEGRYAKPDKHTGLVSALMLDESHALAVGYIQGGSTQSAENIALVEFDHRGRMVKENLYKAKGNETPVKIVALKTGYMVASHIVGEKGTRDKVRLSFLGADRAFKAEKILSDPSYDYRVEDVTALKSGFIVIAHAAKGGSVPDEYSILMRFDADGKQAWQRAFRPGEPGQIRAVEPVPQGGYIAVGDLGDDGIKRTGWILRLADDGALMWQQVYPRGAHASLASVQTDGMNFYAAGEVRPLDGKPASAWIMMTDDTGSLQWQEYFRRNDLAFSVENLFRQTKDGRLTLVMNAQPKLAGAQAPHMRMLTLSPRGAILHDEAHVDGAGAAVQDASVSAGGNRVLVITVDAGDNAASAAGDSKAAAALTEKKALFQRGWVMVAPPLGRYNDPCVKRTE